MVIRYRLDLLLPDSLTAPLWVRIFLGAMHIFPGPKIPRGERLRFALEELGPVFVKFGQLLSTRRDLFPEDIADELQKLQDQVPPFPSDQARELIEKALGSPISKHFTDIDEEPLASASVFN